MNLDGWDDYLADAERFDEERYSEQDSLHDALFGKQSGPFCYDDDPLEFRHFI